MPGWWLDHRRQVNDPIRFNLWCPPSQQAPWCAAGERNCGPLSLRVKAKNGRLICAAGSFTRLFVSFQHFRKRCFSFIEQHGCFADQCTTLVDLLLEFSDFGGIHGKWIPGRPRIEECHFPALAQLPVACDPD